MEQMEDLELDRLIAEAFEREELLGEISTQVMRDIRREARRTTLRKWARLVTYAFAMPFVLCCFAFGSYYVYTQVAMGPEAKYAFLVGVALSSATILAFAERFINDFSVDEV